MLNNQMQKKTVPNNTKNRMITIFITILVLMIPILFSDQKYLMVLLTITGINIIISSGLDVLYGFSGQISMGHATFYALGAYGTAILSTTYGWNPWLAIFIATITATVFAFFVALPITKLVFMFLSLVTIAIGEITYQVIVNFFPDLTGGTTGFSGIPKLSFFGIVLKERSHFLLLVIAIMIICVFLKYTIINSKVGRAFVAIRENTVAAGGMGINVRKYKAFAFAISAAYTALAGALFAHFMGYISPESFTRQTSTMFLTMVLFGGSGTIIGPILGASVLTIFSELIQAFGEYQMLIYGILIIIVVLFAPNGIAGIAKTVLNSVMKKRRKDLV